MHTSVEATLEDVLATGHPVAGENLQARLRAIIVMGYANANGSMAVTTEINRKLPRLLHALRRWLEAMRLWGMCTKWRSMPWPNGSINGRLNKARPNPVVFNLDQTAFGRIGSRPDGPRHAAAL